MYSVNLQTGGDFVNKIDKTVLKETGYIAIWVVIFSVIMEAVFLIINQWDYTVLLGNLLSITAAILNFLLMGITVQKAVVKEEKDAKSTMKMSQNLRILGLFVVAVIGAALPCFNTYAVLIPLLFPRIAVGIRMFFNKKSDNDKNEEVKESE
jgi:hypothetical protein